MDYDNGNVQNYGSQTNSVKFKYGVWEFCLANGMRHLVAGVIAILLLLFAGAFGLAVGILILIPVIHGFISLYLTVGKEHYFHSKKDEHELTQLIDDYFNSKQRMSTRKWLRTSGDGRLNYEIEVMDFRPRGGGGLYTTVSIYFNHAEDGGIIVGVWISKWSLINIGLTPRGVFKASSGISGLMKYLNQYA